MDGYPEKEIATIGKRKVRFTPGVHVRNQVGFVSPFTLDRFGQDYAEGGMTTGRIRINPTLAVNKKYKLVGNLDLANGRWAPDGSDDPVIDAIIRTGQPPARTTLRTVDPARELYMEYRFSFGLLRLGQQAFTWGQGMLANNGNYGIPLIGFAFGSEAQAYASIYFVTSSLMSYTVGVLIASLGHVNREQDGW